MSQSNHHKDEGSAFNLDPMEHALDVLIEADKKVSGDKYHSGIHFIFKAIQNDPRLVTKFCDQFLGKIIKEMDHLAQSGSFSDLTRRQMLANLYQNLPEMRKLAEGFSDQISSKKFPWVQQFISQTEQNLQKGLDTAEDQLVITAIQDIGRYSAATGGCALFTTMMNQAKERIHLFFQKTGSSAQVQSQIARLTPKLQVFGIEISKSVSAASR
ncbi:MAG: hypothetical protein JSS62_05970 [Verrucomicrobia bacterium]|nr:hypothetical protein [Verrucomicrobiota bacterium]MBS0647104.1 hypothetical protein [Verrucomicrobiota bacterium]